MVAGVVKGSFTAEQMRTKHTVTCFALRLSFKYNVADSYGSDWLINPFLRYDIITGNLQLRIIHYKVFCNI